MFARKMLAMQTRSPGALHRMPLSAMKVTFTKVCRQSSTGTSRAKKKYNHTVTPLEFSTSNGSATLKAKLAGTFPGSPVIANFHFALVNDQIASLQIRSQPTLTLNA